MKSLMTVSLLSLLLLAGCSTQRFTINGNGSNGEDKFAHFFVYGIGQTDTVDAAGICQGAGKVEAVEAKQTFLNGLIQAFTWGIYAPRSYKVTCRS